MNASSNSPVRANPKSNQRTGRARTPSRPRRARGLPIVPVFLLAVLLCVLLLDGYVHKVPATEHLPYMVASDWVPEKVLRGGPVLDATGSTIRTYRVPKKTIVLTFDDGPDPTWTPKILKVLKKHKVHGTFFVVGQLTVRYPGVVRDLVNSGQDVGLHTFSRPDILRGSKADIDGELARSQLALAGAAGITSSLVRPADSSVPDRLDNLSWPAVQYLGSKGYLTVLNDTGSEHWLRTAVHGAANRPVPEPTGRSAVVLMYESGDKVAQTVHALDVLIPRLQARGYRFTTLSKAMGAESFDHPPTSAGLWKGRAFVAAVQLSQVAVRGLFVLLAVTGLLVLFRLVMMLVFARRHARVRNDPDFSWGPDVIEPVSVVVPAYNERECIANTVRSLAASNHPVEIIVVDDGSTDDTAEIVKSLGLPGVTLVRQPNSGKATALNTGIAWASYELIVMMDGDTVFEPATVHNLVQPFANPRVGAVAGNAKVGNRDRVIGKWQHIEYVMGFNLDRRMYDLLRCMPTIPGAVGAFRRTALRDAGMMTEDTLAEDTDITMALHRAGWDVAYQENALAWTEAPGTMTQLWRQRYRWSYGTMQAIWKHRRSLIERGPSGRFGRVGLPLISVFQVLAPLLAPLVDIAAVYGLVSHNPWRTLLVWAGLLGVQAISAAYAFRLDREDLRSLWALPLQQVAYRQVMYLVLLHSCITALTGNRLRWHKLRRTGEVGAPPGPAVRAS